MEQPIISHFTDNDIHAFSGCYLYLNKFPRARGRYTLIDRGAPRPQGFAEALGRQLKLMESLTISEDEIHYMIGACQYFPTWFYTFLRGYRYDSGEVTVSQDDQGHLSVTVEGLLWKIAFWEVPILALISQLSRQFPQGPAAGYDPGLEREKLKSKTRSFLENGLSFADFGTAQRFSFDHQKLAAQCAAEAAAQAPNGPGKFLGTANVWFSRLLGLKPVGVVNHQAVSFCGAIFGYKEANYLAMKYWQETFDSDLGIFIYDTFGWNAFQENFGKKYAKLFEGLRVDSGDDQAAVDKIVAKYRELGIDPRTKTLTFSNRLNLEKALEIHRYCRGKIGVSFGLSAWLTGDVAGTAPCEAALKLSAAKLTEKKEWQKAINLSDDPEKFTGDPDEIEIARKTLGL